MDHLALCAHVGDVEAHGALHAVQVVVQARAAVHEQGGGDPVEVQADRQVVLEVRVDQLDGPLELVVRQGHPVVLGNGEFTHGLQPVL